MKIDPVTYEVDMSAGTHPLYVWEAPVRVWHWAMMVCMFVMIVTGFLIGAPLVSNLGDTWATYDFAYIRFAHFAAGIIYTVLFIYRLYWAVVGNKYSRQIFIPPLWSWKWWKGVFGQVAYYLFMKKTSAEYAGHNPLAQLAHVRLLRVGQHPPHHHGSCALCSGLGCRHELDGLVRMGVHALWRCSGRAYGAPCTDVRADYLHHRAYVHVLP